MHVKQAEKTNLAIYPHNETIQTFPPELLTIG